MARCAHERVAVVTGAATAIGRQMALDLARRGTRLALADPDEAGLAQCEQACLQQGAMVEAVVTDPADWNQVEILAARCLERFRQMDVWIQHAATSLPGPLDEAAPDALQRLFALNLMGTLHGLRAALKTMGEAGGQVLCLTADPSCLPIPRYGAYQASQAAVLGLVAAVQAAWIRSGHPVVLSQLRIRTPDPKTVSRTVLDGIGRPQPVLVAEVPAPIKAAAWAIRHPLALGAAITGVGWWLSRRAA